MVALRMAEIDELRDTAAALRLKRQMKQAEESKAEFDRKKKTKKDDLVLLRRLAQDNQHSYKLEPR